MFMKVGGQEETLSRETQHAFISNVSYERWFLRILKHS